MILNIIKKQDLTKKDDIFKRNWKPSANNPKMIKKMKIQKPKNVLKFMIGPWTPWEDDMVIKLVS